MAVLAALHIAAPDHAVADDCANTFQEIARQMRAHIPTTASSTQIRDEILLRGQFPLKAIEGHDDIFSTKLADGTPLIFRPGENRALKEVTAFRFAKEAGFDVPTTVFAEINGVRGSAQLRIEGMPTAADLDRLSEFKPEKLQQMDAATKVFDALLGVNDRNPTNYLVRPNGGQILIDPEQMFHHDRSANALLDGEKQPVTVQTIRKFILLNSERAKRLADIVAETNFVWALRSMSSHEIEDFRGRLKLYRRLYREATTPKETSKP